MELKITFNCIVQFHVIILLIIKTIYLCPAECGTCSQNLQTHLSCTSAQRLMMLLLCSTQSHINL